MSVFAQEIKQNVRAFFFWMIGVGFLMYVGIAESTALFSEPDAITQMFAGWPKIVLATFGFAGLDITSLAGYFGTMWFYAALCIALYALGLGVKLTTREISDKNADFIYSKPLPRTAILLQKTGSHFVCLILFAALTYLFSAWAIGVLGIENTIVAEMILLCGGLLIIALVYYGVGAVVGALHAQKGGLASYMVFLVTYVVGIFYDISESGRTVLRLLAPIKYFDPVEIVDTVAYSNGYIVFSAILCATLLCCAYLIMSRKDL